MGAGGGGCSLFVTAQMWQQKLKVWPKTACGTKRLAADVSAVTDPYTGFDTFNISDGGTGWETIGGNLPFVSRDRGNVHVGRWVTRHAYPALTLYGTPRSQFAPRRHGRGYWLLRW